MNKILSFLATLLIGYLLTSNNVHGVSELITINDSYARKKYDHYDRSRSKYYQDLYGEGAGMIDKEILELEKNLWMNG